MGAKWPRRLPRDAGRRSRPPATPGRSQAGAASLPSAGRRLAQPDNTLVPKAKAWVSHFENMYNGRWGHSQADVDKMQNLTAPVIKKCDPSKYDWKTPAIKKRYFE